jgi:hypothetical protein
MAGDEPAVLLGSNRAANAVEQVLLRLEPAGRRASHTNAAARGITLEAVTIAFTGSLDLRGFLGISDRVRSGFEAIRVLCTIPSSAPPAAIEDMLRQVGATSPVTDIMRHSVPMTIELVVPPGSPVNEAVIPLS